MVNLESSFFTIIGHVITYLSQDPLYIHMLLSVKQLPKNAHPGRFFIIMTCDIYLLDGQKICQGAYQGLKRS